MSVNSFIYGREEGTSTKRSVAVDAEGFLLANTIIQGLNGNFAEVTPQGALKCQVAGISFSGDVVVGTVEITDTNGQPILTNAQNQLLVYDASSSSYLSSISTKINSLDVSVSNFPSVFGVTGPVGITGGVTVLNPVTDVSVSNFPSVFGITGPVGITGGVTVLNPVTDISVSNFPATWTISGPVTITNTSFGVTGSVTVLNPVTDISVSNFPTYFGVTGPVGITGGVTVLNPVTDISISNFPAAWSVSGPVGITGGVTVLNPVTSITVSGPIDISGVVQADICGQWVNIINQPTEQVIIGYIAGLPVYQTVLGVGNPVTDTKLVSFLNSPTVEVSGLDLNTNGSINVVPMSAGGTGLNIDSSGYITANINGPVTISNTYFGVTGPVGITGSVTVLNPVTDVSISNLPAIWSVSGAVSVNNFPTVFGVTGPVGITGTVRVDGSVNVTNLPTESVIVGYVMGVPQYQTVVSTGNPVTDPKAVDWYNNPVATVIGTDVNKTPLKINIDTGSAGLVGSISTVTLGRDNAGNYNQLNVDASGALKISNYPSSVGITGPVGITGAVSVLNFPSKFEVSGSVVTDISGQTVKSQTITKDIQTSATSEVTSINVPGYVSGPTIYSQTAMSTVANIRGIVDTYNSANINARAATAGGYALAVNVENASIPVTLSGQTVNVGNFPSSYSISGPVSLTGAYLYDNGTLLGVTGSFSSTIAPGTFVGVTGTTLTKDISANETLTLIESDISSGILVKGQDDTGVRYPIYVDVDGVQRTEIVSGHAETAKYIFETDASVITTGTSWRLDTRGREGWYYTGTVSSTLKWYGNNGISTPPAMDFNRMQSVWMIATLDDVQTTPLPKIRVVTTASIWDYVIPSPGTTLFNGEQYLFYYGNKAIALNPSNHPILLTRTLVSGPGANSEDVLEVNVVTLSGTNFLLNKTGIWNQDLAQQFATVFRDIRAQTAEDNLISLDFSGAALKTTITEPVALVAGTEVNSKLYATLAGSTTISEYVSVETAPYRPQFPSTQYVNELCTAAHLRANLWDPSFNYTTALQVFPSASLSATGPTGPARYSLSTTVDNTVASPANVRVIGGITGINLSAATSSIQIADVCFNATVRPINPFSTNLGTTGVNGLVTDSALFGYNVSAGTVSLLTTDISGTRNQLQTRDADAVAELVTIDNKIVQGYNTTNDSSVIGLNINQIRPKVRFYNMRGVSTVADVNMLLGSVSSTRYFYSDAYGIANLKPWWAYSESVGRTINYEYVDGSGNILNASKAIPATTWTRLPNAAGVDTNFLINKWSTNTSQTTTSGNVYIAHTAASSAYSMFGGNFADTFQANFTVPTGFVACITNVSFFSNAADDYTILIKWRADGIRETVYYWSTVKILNENYYNQFGGCGGVFTAGESIGWGMLNSASNKNFSATIMLMPV